MNQDKRRQDRLDYSTDVFVQKSNFRGSENGVITNISINGLKISTPLDLEQDQPVSVCFENPKTYEKIRILGDVSWVRQEDASVSAGIALHPMDQGTQKKMSSLFALIDSDFEFKDVRTQFEDQTNLQAEIEKILHVDPMVPSDSSKSDNNESQYAEIDASPVPTKRRKRPESDSSFRTILLTILLAIVGGVAYFVYQQNQTPTQLLTLPKQEDAKPLETQTPAAVITTEMESTLASGQIVEQDIPNKPEATATKQATPQPAKETKEPVAPEVSQKVDTPTASKPTQKPAALPEKTILYQNAFEFSQDHWLRELSWLGDDKQLTLTWRFSAPLQTDRITIQKLDFDPNNIRFLVQVPANNDPLDYKEVTLNHPMVNSVRLGLHGSMTDREMHMVFDVANPNIELSPFSVTDNTLTLIFTQ